MAAPAPGAAIIPSGPTLRCGARTAVSSCDLGLELFDHPRQSEAWTFLVFRAEIGAGVLDRAPFPYAAINRLNHAAHALAFRRPMN
jgi:hypothetical protein